MSIKIMAAVFENETLGPTERLIMLALADHADEDGSCYPSIDRLCRRTGLGERAIQTNIRKLVSQGYIHISPGGGKGKTNLYFVSANPASYAPIAATKPRTKCTPHEMHPAPDAPQTPHMVRSNPAPDAPEPSGTIIEPSVESAAHATDDAKAPAKARLPDGWVLDDDGWEYARSLQLTDREIEEIADDFREYWKERRDAGSRKSEGGWKRTWKNRCRDIAPQYRRNRTMAGQSFSGGRGQGSSIASIVARRRLAGQD